VNATRSARPEHAVPNWRHHAACWGEDPELFYLTAREDTAAAQPQIAEAKAVCQRGPVRAECLDWALSIGDEFGILGGLTAGERRPLRRESATRSAGTGRVYPADRSKRCRLCSRMKPVTEFTSHRGRSDGVSATCKECQSYARQQQRLQGPGQHRPRRKAAV
jgi:WhiB family redox-sensing transcriptional regulator